MIRYGCFLVLFHSFFIGVTAQDWEWATAFGGKENDFNVELVVDGEGNSYFTGYYNDTVDFGGVQYTTLGSQDIYTMKINASGNMEWVRVGGGTSIDRGDGITLDTDGNLYVTGLFSGTLTIDSMTWPGNGSLDIFLTKYTSGGDLLWTKTFGSQSTDVAYGLKSDGQGHCVYGRPLP